MREDDDFVLSSYEAMKHRSPVCLIFALFHLCKKLLKERMAIAVAGVAPWEEHLNTRRSMIRAILRAKLDGDELKLEMQRALGHDCHGKTLEEERDEWKRKGEPLEAVFTVHIARVREVWDAACRDVTAAGAHPREVASLRSAANLPQ